MPLCLLLCWWEDIYVTNSFSKLFVCFVTLMHCFYSNYPTIHLLVISTFVLWSHWGILSASMNWLILKIRILQHFIRNSGYSFIRLNFQMKKKKDIIYLPHHLNQISLQKAHLANTIPIMGLYLLWQVSTIVGSVYICMGYQYM